MKHLGRLLIVPVLAIAVLATGQATAKQPITQELHVTAVVPAHRDIVVDHNGTIQEITSNTLEDVTPTVYYREVQPDNRRILTSELYKEYRAYVPEGTAKYGVLYKQDILTALLAGPHIDS
jgi:hypothetical protein